MAMLNNQRVLENHKPHGGVVFWGPTNDMAKLRATNIFFFDKTMTVSIQVCFLFSQIDR